MCILRSLCRNLCICTISFLYTFYLIFIHSLLLCFFCTYIMMLNVSVECKTMLFILLVIRFWIQICILCTYKICTVCTVWHQTLSMSIFIFKKEKKWHNDYTFNMYSIYTSLNEGQSYNFKHKCFHLLNHLLTEIITVSRMSWPYFVSGTTRLACKRKNAI